MSPYSPQSSGVGTPSSPLTGTDPTVYSPDVARRARSNTKSRRDNLSIDTVVANAKHALRNLDEAEARRALKLPAPKSRKLEGDFVNELDEHSNDFISRYLKVVMLPDGTQHGEDPDHEFVAVCRQMKPVSLFPSSSISTLTPSSMLASSMLYPKSSAKRRPSSS